MVALEMCEPELASSFIEVLLMILLSSALGNFATCKLLTNLMELAKGVLGLDLLITKL